MIVQNISRDGLTDISFTLPRADRARAETVLAELAREIGAEGVTADDRVAKVSVVGVGMRSHAGVDEHVFHHGVAAALEPGEHLAPHGDLLLHDPCARRRRQGLLQRGVPRGFAQSPTPA